MRDTLNLRASALPLAFRCGASIRRGVIELNASHEAADNGTAAHAILTSLPRTNRVDWENLEDTAKSFGAEPHETRMLVAMGVKLWNQVSESFQGALTEVELRAEVAPGVFLTGHADILAVSQMSMRVGDWKTGRKDADHNHQFRAYGAMALLSSQDIEEVTSTGLWVRDQEIENYTMSRSDAQRWVQSLLDQVVNWDGVYRPGRHCLYCPRSHECEAANAMVRRDVAAIADKSLVARVEGDELASMSAGDIIAVVQKAELVKKYAERVREAVRLHVERHGDVVADGVRLTVVREERRELVTGPTFDVFEKLNFSDDERARAVRVSVSAVEEVVRERAPKGFKKKAVEELGALLVESGAVTKNTITKLKETRT